MSCSKPSRVKFGNVDSVPGAVWEDEAQPELQQAEQGVICGVAWSLPGAAWEDQAQCELQQAEQEARSIGHPDEVVPNSLQGKAAGTASGVEGLSSKRTQLNWALMQKSRIFAAGVAM